MAMPVISIVVHPKRPELKFLIMDSPNDINISHYVRELKEREVVDVVRVCKEQNYDKATLESEGITVHVRRARGVALCVGGSVLPTSACCRVPSVRTDHTPTHTCRVTCREMARGAQQNVPPGRTWLRASRTWLWEERGRG